MDGRNSEIIFYDLFDVCFIHEFSSHPTAEQIRLIGCKEKKYKSTYKKPQMSGLKSWDGWVG